MKSLLGQKSRNAKSAVQSCDFVNSELNAEKSSLDDSNFEIVVGMSTINSQKEKTSKYEHSSSVINKIFAGSETRNTIPDCKSTLSTLSLTKEYLTKNYKIKL